MERYTQWRDKATGISPFLPVLHTNVIGVSETPIGNLIKTAKLDVLFSIVLFTVKAVLVAPFVILSFVLSLFLGKSKIASLNRFILFITGLTSYELTIQNLKAKNLNKSFYPKRGDVFLVNYSSPLDFFLLSILSNDEFVILVPNAKGQLQLVTSWGFIQKSLSGYEQDEGANYKIDFGNLQNKIIYIFPEGTTSNGKAILPFPLNQTIFDDFISKLNEDKKTHKIRTIGIKLYPSTLVTPLQYSSFGYIYKVLTLLSYSAKIRINIPNELDAQDTNLDKIRQSFTSNGKFKLVTPELNIDAKIKFIENYVGRR